MTSHVAKMMSSLPKLTDDTTAVKSEPVECNGEIKVKSTPAKAAPTPATAAPAKSKVVPPVSIKHGHGTRSRSRLSTESMVPHGSTEDSQQSLAEGMDIVEPSDECDDQEPGDTTFDQQTDDLKLDQQTGGTTTDQKSGGPILDNQTGGGTTIDQQTNGDMSEQPTGDATVDQQPEGITVEHKAVQCQLIPLRPSFADKCRICNSKSFKKDRVSEWVGCNYVGNNQMCDYWVHVKCTGYNFKLSKSDMEVRYYCPQHMQ